MTNQITSTLIIPHLRKRSQTSHQSNMPLLNRFLEDVGYDDIIPNIQEVNDVNITKQQNIIGSNIANTGSFI